MTSEPKTLVILDTNIIRNNLEWEKDFSVFEPRGDFLKLIEVIESSKLQNSIFVGLPEIVIEEFISNRSDNFKKQIEYLISSYEKLKKVPCFDFSKIVIPSDSYDYNRFIKNKINEYLKNKPFIFVLNLEKKHYTKTLSTLMQKAVLKEQPFTDGGKGFKDALIWEIILNFEQMDKYSHIFLLTENQRDFDNLSAKFNEKFSKELNLKANTTSLISNLEEIYGWRVKYSEMLSYLQSDYFESKLIEFLTGSYELKMNGFSILNILTISESSSEELKKFDLPIELEDVSNLLTVHFLFVNNAQKFDAKLIIESVSKEIIDVYYEESK
ncbi:MAG: PIN domain-containing protein [Candidatus Anstonellales archaeon]